MSVDKTVSPRPTRRALMLGGIAAVAAPAILRFGRAAAADRVIRIGHVTPKTGPLAFFGETDDFVIAQVKKQLNNVIEIGGKSYPIEIISKDTQSNPNRAAEVTADLVQRDKVDLILAAGAPETTNPVADQAEVNGVPCVTTACPWQAYFFGRKGDPAKGFDWTYHYCFGLEDAIGAFLGLWQGADTKKVIGTLFANDADGNAWNDAEHGLPPALKAAGYQIVDASGFQPLTDNFTSAITKFKEAGVEIVTGTMITPDFATFWGQAAQQGFKPKIVTVGKAYLLPSSFAAMGPRGDGLSCEIPWHPKFPYKSGLTGQGGEELTAAYTAAVNRPAPFLVGMMHSLFEVAVDVLRRTEAIEQPESVVAAIKATDYQSIQGPVNWSKGPVKNVTKTPMVAGQWNGTGPDAKLLIGTNAGHPDIPVESPLKLLAG